MTVFPRTGCSVIVQKNGKVLLIKRGKEPYKGYWSLPGGAQEAGETLEECARRELAEETGLVAGELSFVTVRDRFTRDTNNQIQYHYVLATFLADMFTGDPVAKDDAIDVGWFSLGEMRNLTITPDTDKLVAEVLTKSSTGSQEL